MRRTVISVLALPVVIVGLAACSSSSSASSSASPSDSMVGGMTECNEANLTAAYEADLAANSPDQKVMSVDGFECSDGWGVLFPTIGTTEDDAVTVTAVLEAEGQFWIVKDRADVCGTPDANDPTKVPADAQVPAAIYQPACNTN